jgi:hypothetical protein
MKPDTQAATASSTPVVCGKDVTPTIEATETVLSELTAPTSNHYHERRDDIDKVDNFDVPVIHEGNRLNMDDCREPSGVRSPTSEAGVSGIFLSRSGCDDPVHNRLGKMNTGEENLMEYDSDDEGDEDDEMIEAEFETVLATDPVGTETKTAAVPDPTQTDLGAALEHDTDPILMTRSTPRTLFSDEDDDIEDVNETSETDDVAVFHSNQMQSLMGNQTPDFDETEMESGAIEVEYIESVDEDYEEIFLEEAEDDDVLSDVGNPISNDLFHPKGGSQSRTALVNVDKETQDKRHSIEGADKNVNNLTDKENDGSIVKVDRIDESNECITHLADSMISQFSGEEQLCEHKIGEETTEGSLMDNSDRSKSAQLRKRAGLITFSESDESEDSLQSLEHLEEETTETNASQSTFSEDEKDVKRATLGEKKAETGCTTDSSIVLPDATWSFDSTMKTKKQTGAVARNTPDLVVELATLDEEGSEKESQSQEQRNVGLENKTWSFDSTLKIRKTDNSIAQSEGTMSPTMGRSTEDELDKNDFPELLTNQNGDNERSVLVNLGESVEMDSDSSSSDGETTETARDTTQEVDSDDFDAILESVAEYIESHDWDSFVIAIKARPSLAVLSTADFSSVSSEISGFVPVGEEENLLLHEVCKNDPTSEAVSTLVSLHETAVKTPGQLGYLPLHIACAYGASVAVVDVLLKAYPEAVESVGKGNMLPIHISCKRGVSGDIIKLLLTTFPAGSIACDIFNHTPMYYALSLPEGIEKQETLQSLQQCAENQLKMKQGSAADRDMDSLQKDDKIVSLETELSKQSNEINSHKMELAQEKSKLFSLQTKAADQEAKLLQLEQEMLQERSKTSSIELHLEEERSKLFSLQAKTADQEDRLSKFEEEMIKEQSKSSAFELELEEERTMLSSLQATTADQLAKLSQLEQEVIEEQSKALSLEVELKEERTKLTSMQVLTTNQEAKLSQLQEELIQEQSKAFSLQQELKEERRKLSSLQMLTIDQEAILLDTKSRVEEERAKSSLMEQQWKTAEDKLITLQARLDEQHTKSLALEVHLEEERCKSSSLEDKLRQEFDRVDDRDRNLQSSLSQLEQTNSELEKEQSATTERFQLVQNEIAELKVRFLIEKQQLYQKAETQLVEALQIVTETEEQLVKERMQRLVERQHLYEKAGQQLVEVSSIVNGAEKELEEEKIKMQAYVDLLEGSKLELAELKVRFLLEKQQLYQKTDMQLVEALKIVNETEEKLVDERTQRLVERQELHEKAGRQLVEVSSLVDEAEKDLEEEKMKLQEYEELLAGKQKIIDEEQKKYKGLLLKLDHISAMNGEKVKQLEQDLTAQKSVIESQAKQIEAFTKSMANAGEEQNRRLAEETLLIGEIEATIAQKKKLLSESKEIIRVIEQSNAMKSDLLEAQQKKVEALEIGRREKETQIKLNQEAFKRLEESIAQKQALENEEAAKVATLKATLAARKASLDMEEDQIKELDYSLARKQALIELEQMKEKTLEQTIAQKNELIESEIARIKDLELVIAEKQLRLISERNSVQAVEVTVAEKEAVLQAERALAADIRRALQEKEDLLEKMKKTEKLVHARTKETERLLALEQKNISELKASQAEKESLMKIQKAAVEEAELKLARKESLMKREEYIAKSLERFASRKREIMATGPSSYLVHATVNVKFLLKEAFLVSGYEKAHIREQSSKKDNSVARSSAGNIYESLVLKGPKELLSSFVRVFGAASTIESGNEKRF